MWTCTQVISDDNHQASTRAVCVVELFSIADGRTERLRVLLTVSSNCHCFTRTYLIQLLIVDVSGLSKEINAALEY